MTIKTVIPAKAGIQYWRCWYVLAVKDNQPTLAFEMERRLLDLGHVAYVLDGNNVRHRLSRDLSFLPEHRTENIGRIAEVAKLFNDAEIILITAFISPYREDRDMAREIVGTHPFVEAHLATDISVCEARDSKGLYKKARGGASWASAELQEPVLDRAFTRFWP